MLLPASSAAGQTRSALRFALVKLEKRSRRLDLSFVEMPAVALGRQPQAFQNLVCLETLLAIELIEETW